MTAKMSFFSCDHLLLVLQNEGMLESLFRGHPFFGFVHYQLPNEIFSLFRDTFWDFDFGVLLNLVNKYIEDLLHCLFDSNMIEWSLSDHEFVCEDS